MTELEKPVAVGAAPTVNHESEDFMANPNATTSLSDSQEPEIERLPGELSIVGPNVWATKWGK